CAAACACAPTAASAQRATLLLPPCWALTNSPSAPPSSSRSVATWRASATSTPVPPALLRTDRRQQTRCDACLDLGPMLAAPPDGGKAGATHWQGKRNLRPEDHPPIDD